MEPTNITEIKTAVAAEIAATRARITEASAELDARVAALLGGLACPVPDPTPVVGDFTWGRGGELAALTFQSFTDPAGLTSQYHVYADGLDWSRPVGLLIYADGTGEWGLKNPNDPYLLAGPTGMVATARKHNMLLLTPMSGAWGRCVGTSPETTGECWYATSGSVNSLQKAAWSVDLIRYIHARYNIDKSRTAFGGYSSGAEWSAHFFGPKAASSLITAGVGVCISYGGYYGGTPTITDAFKRNVAMVWDCGDTGETEVKALAASRKGEAFYRGQGFTTELNVFPGQKHVDPARGGKFGTIMDRYITKYLRAA